MILVRYVSECKQVIIYYSNVVIYLFHDSWWGVWVAMVQWTLPRIDSLHLVGVWL